jgi:hypothetical protein
MNRHWPRLSTLPSTNALVVNSIGLTWATYVASVLGWRPPDGWLAFIVATGVTAAGQFWAKRHTWKPESPQNGAAP